MHNITLLTIGSLKNSSCKELCFLYEERLQKSCRFTIEELKASTVSDSEKQRQEESERVLERLKKTDGVVWVCDERGKQMSSVELSKEIETLKDSGTSLSVVLGGAFGFDDAVRARADRIVSLSEMVFPHELCRVMLLEQVYRAQEISRGSGYHHV